MKKLLLCITTLLLSHTSLAFELSQWSGTWERSNEKGELVERIIASEKIPGQMITSNVEYFSAGKSVAKGAVIMSKHEEKINFSFHVTGGTLIQAKSVNISENSMLLEMQRSSTKPEQDRTVYSRFTYQSEGKKEVILQELFSDAEATKLLLSVVFNKVS